MAGPALATINGRHTSHLKRFQPCCRISANHPRIRTRVFRSQKARRAQLRTSRHAVPNFNPQNVPDPQVMPSKEFSPEETVRVQLDALQSNDDPWPNHGLQTAYEFGEDIGGMERSRYFGYSKDLYHFDHFMGQFQNEFSDLLTLQSYKISRVEQSEGDTYTVLVESKCGSKEVALKFVLARKDIGRKKGALMTRQLLKV